MMKNLIIILFVTSIFSIFSFAQNSKKESLKISLGESFIKAWEKGENSGNYSSFKSLLSDKFNLFSHPLIGKFSDSEALVRLNNLIIEREKVSNNLTFSDVKISTADKYVTVQFNSKGKVQGGKFPYEGFNIIIFYFENKKITGFQEYFGYVNPNWFK